MPFSDYLKQSKVFVLRSSKESRKEEESFETVTDSDKPYIHCMLGGAILGNAICLSIDDRKSVAGFLISVI